MPLVEVDRLAKSFTRPNGVTEVLKEATFRIDGPAVIGLLGPNGVGKSVTMRLLAGLLQPDAGRIRIDGKPPSACRIGFVPASNPVFGWSTVLDDVGIGMQSMGVPKEERRRHVEKFLRRFSMDLPLRTRTCFLSTGQRQLVNLARALAGPNPPKVLILDEPWASLSAAVREEVLACLDSIRLNMDVTIFLSAHSLDSAIRASDWILPIPERPAQISQSDLIPVGLPRPRSAQFNCQPGFQQVLARVEAVFRGAYTINL